MRATRYVAAASRRAGEPGRSCCRAGGLRAGLRGRDSTRYALQAHVRFVASLRRPYTDNGSCELSLWGGCPSATWRALLLIGLDARVAEHVGGAVAKFCVAVTEHPGAALRRAVDERAPCPAAAVSARNGSPAASGALVVFSLEAPKGHSTAVGFHSPLLVRRRELQTTDFVAAVATTLNKLLDICAAVARSVPGGGDDGTSLQTALLSAVGLRLWPPLCHAVVENVLKVRTRAVLPATVSLVVPRSSSPSRSATSAAGRSWRPAWKPLSSALRYWALSRTRPEAC